MEKNDRPKLQASFAKVNKTEKEPYTLLVSYYYFQNTTYIINPMICS